MATNYRTQFQGDLDNCRNAILAANLAGAVTYYAMAKASHAAMIDHRTSDQGSSMDSAAALDGLREAIEFLRESQAQDVSGGAATMGVGSPCEFGGGSGVCN